MAKTPTKSEILAKATEMFHNDRAMHNDPSFSITPTEQELKEGGYTSSAQSTLMRDAYRSAIESKEYYDTEKENFAKTSETKTEGLLLDINEAKKSNVLVSGANQTGKSLLAMSISDLLIKQGWQVVVFDNSSVWKRKSNISTCYDVSEKNSEYLLSTTESAIFDISFLTSDLQKRFVETVLRNIWDVRLKLQLSTWLLLVFEEFQLYAKNVRGSLSQNLLRIMSVGANVRIRCLGVSVDLALIDPLFVRLCGQRFHFRLGNESGAKTRFKGYYGKDLLEKALALDVGECIYVNVNRIELCKIPMFQKSKSENREWFKLNVVVS